jgi:hypothetical protein
MGRHVIPSIEAPMRQSGASQTQGDDLDQQRDMATPRRVIGMTAFKSEVAGRRETVTGSSWPKAVVAADYR